MTRLSHEQLLGYLLGALDRQEGLEVEQAALHDAELRAELEKLRRSLDTLGLLEDAEDDSPPLCLAARTCEFVETRIEAYSAETVRLQSVTLQSMTADAIAAAEEDYNSDVAAGSDSRVRLTPVSHSEVQGYAYRKLDLLVICSTVLVGAAVCFPLLYSNKFQANVTYCQNQLAQFGQSLHQYSDLQPDGAFPHVPESGPRSFAGVFAPTLVSNQLLRNPKSIFCLGSPRFAAAEPRLPKIPTLAEIDHAPAEVLKEFQANAGGDYGYNMGFFADGDRVSPPRNSRRADYPLLTDAPHDDQPFRASPNHAGRGQNFLYEGGNVRFLNVSGMLRDNPSDSPLDDPFHNRRGKVAAGVDLIDAVLGRSDDPPLPLLP